MVFIRSEQRVGWMADVIQSASEAKGLEEESWTSVVKHEAQGTLDGLKLCLGKQVSISISVM